MATFTLNRPDLYPAGTSVGAYPESNWPNDVDHSAAPLGSPTNTQPASATGLTFTGLADQTHYVAYALVSGQHRYVGFIAGADLHKISGAVLDPDSTMAADSDGRVPTQKAVKAHVAAAGGSSADASTTTKGITKLATAPAVASNPIAVGDNDPRNSNARDPTAHATTHQPGGSDAMAVDAAVGTGSLRTLGTGASQAAQGSATELLANKDTDGTLAANSDTKYASQKATKTYVDTASGLLVPKSVLTTKGDLFVRDATTVVRKAVGTNGYLLRANSAQGDGLEWTFPPGLGSYLVLARWSGYITTAAASGTNYFLVPGGTNTVNTALPVSAVGAGEPWGYQLVGSDFTVPTGLTLQLMLRVTLQVGGTAPAITYTSSLNVITISGGVVTVGAAATGADDCVHTNPAANGFRVADTGDFDLPSNGRYAPIVTLSGTPAGNVGLIAELLRHYV